MRDIHAGFSVTGRRWCCITAPEPRNRVTYCNILADETAAVMVGGSDLPNQVGLHLKFLRRKRMMAADHMSVRQPRAIQTKRGSRHRGRRKALDAMPRIECYFQRPPIVSLASRRFWRRSKVLDQDEMMQILPEPENAPERMPACCIPGAVLAISALQRVARRWSLRPGDP